MARELADETPQQNEVETERGFGTGLRAQLQRRRESAEAKAAEATHEPNTDTSTEGVEYFAAPPPAAAEAASAAADEGANHQLRPTRAPQRPPPRDASSGPTPA